MSIKRYAETIGVGLDEVPDGEWVSHADYLAALEYLNRELAHLVRTKDEYKEEVARLRAELAVKP